MNTLAAILRSALARTAWSEAELARRAGVPQSITHRVLSGQSGNPRWVTVRRLAAALGVSLNAIDRQLPLASRR